ncbi:MAG TPA: signal peptidase II [Syntrophales bacterium]|nr:signal peptidase II [Syntrophales bacterium]HPX10719.1 signal peptidase II [Syntrophales bacterium]HQN78834.1 signal peptidase II [Syntrophales bacterium]HQQ27949.1 signal peptidase II [Syntrophales bacterium]
MTGSMRYVVFFIAAGVVLLVDLATKSAVMSAFSLHESMTVIPGFFDLTYVRNPGAAFGFLARTSPAFRSFFFSGVAVAAILFILYFLFREKEAGLTLTLSLGLIIGGATGNLLDRIRFGEVVDFLDFSIGGYHWPAFNAADSAISVGACLLLYEIFKRKERRKAAGK